MTRKTPSVMWIALLIATAALVLFGCGGRNEEAASGSRSGDEGAAASPGEVAGGAAVEGEYPPPISLPDLEGRIVSLADFEGQVVVLDLWATWCPPCRDEIPFLVSLHEELKDRGLVVVGVGLDRGGADVLRPFVEKNRVTYPILVGDESVQSAYRVTGIPTTLVIGRDGRIAKRHVGYHPSMAGDMRQEIENLLAVGGEEA